MARCFRCERDRDLVDGKYCLTCRDYVDEFGVEIGPSDVVLEETDDGVEARVEQADGE